MASDTPTQCNPQEPDGVSNAMPNISGLKLDNDTASKLLSLLILVNDQKIPSVGFKDNNSTQPEAQAQDAEGQTQDAQAPVTSPQPEVKYPSKRAAMIAKAQAEKSGPILNKQSATARRSALVKTSADKYKPILAGGKNAKSRLKNLQKELAKRKADEEEEFWDYEEVELEGQDAIGDHIMTRVYFHVFQNLPEIAHEELPVNFDELHDFQKFKLVLRKSVEYKAKGFNTITRVKVPGVSQVIEISMLVDILDEWHKVEKERKGQKFRHEVEDEYKEQKLEEEIQDTKSEEQKLVEEIEYDEDKDNNPE